VVVDLRAGEGLWGAIVVALALSSAPLAPASAQRSAPGSSESRSTDPIDVEEQGPDLDELEQYAARFDVSVDQALEELVREDIAQTAAVGIVKGSGVGECDPPTPDPDDFWYYGKILDQINTLSAIGGNVGFGTVLLYLG